MKKFLPLLFLVLICKTGYGQVENPRIQNRNGVSFYGMGASVIGSVSYDYFITPNFNVVTGIGFIGVHAGLNVHLFGGRSDKRLTPYLGAGVVRSLFPFVGVDWLPYYPIGIHYAGARRFNFAFEVAPLQLRLLSWNVAGVKIGYRF